MKLKKYSDITNDGKYEFIFMDILIRIRFKNNIGIALKFYSPSIYIPYKKSIVKMLKKLREVKANEN